MKTAFTCYRRILALYALAWAGSPAFTLAELLIALSILGVIATFTIPKVLQGQQNGQYKAMAKEVAGMVSEAYSTYRLKNSSGAGTGMKDLTPFMNYVSVNTTSQFYDDRPNGWGSVWCGTYQCLKLHNGSVLGYDPGMSFGGITTNNAVWFAFDPDASKTVTGSGVGFWLYYDGKIRTFSTMLPATLTSTVPYWPDPAGDPTWFDWN